MKGLTSSLPKHSLESILIREEDIIGQDEECEDDSFTEEEKKEEYSRSQSYSDEMNVSDENEEKKFDYDLQINSSTTHQADTENTQEHSIQFQHSQNRDRNSPSSSLKPNQLNMDQHKGKGQSECQNKEDFDLKKKSVESVERDEGEEGVEGVEEEKGRPERRMNLLGERKKKGVCEHVIENIHSLTITNPFSDEEANTHKINKIVNERRSFIIKSSNKSTNSGCLLKQKEERHDSNLEAKSERRSMRNMKGLPVRTTNRNTNRATNTSINRNRNVNGKSSVKDIKSGNKTQRPRIIIKQSSNTANPKKGFYQTDNSSPNHLNSNEHGLAEVRDFRDILSQEPGFKNTKSQWNDDETLEEIANLSKDNYSLRRTFIKLLDSSPQNQNDFPNHVNNDQDLFLKST